MSSQAFLYNPTERTLASTGDGFSVPRLTTAGRTAIALTPSDKGMMVYDTTLTTLCVWNGTAWEFVSDNSNGVVSVKDFGAKGDGVTDDTAAILAGLASLTSGGALYFPSGTYKFQRGNGALIADTIIASNVTVYGDGADTLISGYNAAGAIPNDSGNEFYNVFQATGRSGITVKDMAFEGYTTPVSLFNCTDVIVDSIHDNGLLANAGGFLRDKTVYLSGCTRVRITNSNFLNHNFAVYVGAVGATTKECIVTNCNFEQTVAAGSFTSLFPVGVYWYYADGCVVDGCTFRDIYSSLDNGNTGTGIGYGVYEGDGTSGSGIISNNSFRYGPKGLKNAIGVYTNQMQSCSITGNSFYIEVNGRVSSGIRMDSKSQNTNYSVSGNSMRNQSTAISSFAIHLIGISSNSNSPTCAVSANSVTGFQNAFRQEFLGNAKVTVSSNTFSTQTAAGIHTVGDAAIPIKSIQITGNNITLSATNGILFNGYTVGPVITGNVILDGNTTNVAGDSGAAVLFTSFSFGSVIANNTIGNTSYGGGLFTYGVQNASNANVRIFKDITFGNAFVGIANNFQFGRYWTTSPTNGIFDVTKGDFLQNVQLNASGVPGWYCVQKLTSGLTADASSASTTVTVGSTASVAANDIVLLLKDSNPYDADYSTAANWHIDTVALVTNPTQFVLTTGIPAGDGTYLNGVAVAYFARFKAAAAIAA